MDWAAGISHQKVNYRSHAVVRWAGIALCLVLLFSVPVPGVAWGPVAHAVIGHLAENHRLKDDPGLKMLLHRFREPGQRQRVRQALLQTAPPAPGRALRVLANWPDVNKRRFGMLPDDDLRHYVNVPHRARYSHAKHCPAGICSIETLLEQRAILADRRRSLSKRVVALAWVTHLVGDMHQPLHAGNADDRGGNLTCVVWQGQPSSLITIGGKKQCSGANLHALWDSKMIAEVTGFSDPEAAGTYARKLRRLLPLVDAAEPPLKARTATAWRTVVERWHSETQALILLQDIYPRGKAIDHDYVQTHYRTIRLQLLRAAVRLAAMLRRTLNR